MKNYWRNCGEIVSRLTTVKLMKHSRLSLLLLVVAGMMSTPLSAQLSSSYSFKQGHGIVPWLMVYDHGDYVAGDFNGDNTLDVMGLPSAHGSHKVLNEVSWHQGIAFLSAGDGSYRFVRTGARINNTATEWQGDYIAKGPIIVGNGSGGGPSQSLQDN